MKPTKRGHYVLSFDLDFTLANFNLTPFVQTAQKALMKALVLHKGYPKELLTPHSLSRSCSGECFRAVYDTKTMNLLKVGSLGQVLSAFSGWNRLTKEQLTQTYGQEAKISLSVETPKDPSGRFKYFEDYFLNYIIAPLREITDLRSKGDTFLSERSGKQILDEMYSTAEQNYDFVLPVDERTGKPIEWIWPEHFGHFYPEFIAGGQHLVPAISEALIQFLAGKAENIHPVIVSNGTLSHFLTVAKGLELSGGANIFDAFDFIALGAEKPGFFGNQTDCRMISTTDSDPALPIIPKFWPDQMNKILVGGGLNSLLKHLGLNESHQVTFIHVGDSSTTDLGWQKPPIPGIEVVRVGLYRELTDSNPESLKQRVGAQDWGSGLNGISDIDGCSYPTLGYAYFERLSPKLFPDINSPDLLAHLRDLTSA